jgi:hypothetical protein
MKDINTWCQINSTIQTLMLCKWLLLATIWVQPILFSGLLQHSLRVGLNFKIKEMEGCHLCSSNSLLWILSSSFLLKCPLQAQEASIPQELMGTQAMLSTSHLIQWWQIQGQEWWDHKLVEISKGTSLNPLKVSQDHHPEEIAIQCLFIKPLNLKSIPCRMLAQLSSIDRFKHKT